MGQVPTDCEVNVIGFGGGYVAYEFYGRAWFSTDGAAWERVDPETSSTCRDTPEVWPDTIHGAASSASELLLLGTEPIEPELERYQGAVSWISSDGKTWQRSPRIDPVGAGSRIQSAWPISGGWEAIGGLLALEDETTSVSVWQSADGLSWNPGEELWETNPVDIGRSAVAIGVDQAGTRLLSTAAVGTGAFVPGSQSVYGPRLLTSTNGREWDAFEPAFLLSEMFVSGIVAPQDASGEWLLITQNLFGEDPRSWRSPDLETWAEHEVPLPSVTTVVPTREGIILSGCRRSNRCVQYVGTDGVTWTEITPHLFGSLSIADGPVGVLLVGGESGRAWHLAVPNQ